MEVGRPVGERTNATGHPHAFNVLPDELCVSFSPHVGYGSHVSKLVIVSTNARTVIPLLG